MDVNDGKWWSVVHGVIHKLLTQHKLNGKRISHREKTNLALGQRSVTVDRYIMYGNILYLDKAHT